MSSSERSDDRSDNHSDDLTETRREAVEASQRAISFHIRSIKEIEKKIEEIQRTCHHSWISEPDTCPSDNCRFKRCEYCDKLC